MTGTVSKYLTNYGGEGTSDKDRKCQAEKRIEERRINNKLFSVKLNFMEVISQLTLIDQECHLSYCTIKL